MHYAFKKKRTVCFKSVALQSIYVNSWLLKMPVAVIPLTTGCLVVKDAGRWLLRSRNPPASLTTSDKASPSVVSRSNTNTGGEDEAKRQWVGRSAWSNSCEGRRGGWLNQRSWMARLYNALANLAGVGGSAGGAIFSPMCWLLRKSECTNVPLKRCDPKAHQCEGP